MVKYKDIPFEIGKTYKTKFQTNENFIISRLVYNNDVLVLVFGIYEKYPYIGECLINKDRLIPKQEIDDDGIKFCISEHSNSRIESTKPTVLCAAFCGTGKTYVCEKTNINAIEIEYWKYKEGFQKEYIENIKKYIGIVDYIFISTDPDGLKLLHNEGYEITLVYPKKELRNEYLDRYIERDSPYEFIGTFMKHWVLWINESSEQKYCKQIILESGQYLQDVL